MNWLKDKNLLPVTNGQGRRNYRKVVFKIKPKRKTHLGRAFQARQRVGLVGVGMSCWYVFDGHGCFQETTEPEPCPWFLVEADNGSYNEKHNDFLPHPAYTLNRENYNKGVALWISQSIMDWTSVSYFFFFFFFFCFLSNFETKMYFCDQKYQKSWLPCFILVFVSSSIF